ncbi:hypothetical protein [Cupriavidus sp. UYPR2.512]|uniref:hypothetical protein n=1 Tax=Cupriavidus sp. UYPR2.512 TaxID=1080187 RepID=UPI0012FC94F3|nr:hypothetical protein [Cupriavidus sp. UYPR2.512]UIF84606.1 hypothetical protein KAF44_09895 [Cupriavidus necator]
MLVSPDTGMRGLRAAVACLGAKAKRRVPTPSNIHFFVSNIRHISLGGLWTSAALRRLHDFLRVIPVSIIGSLTDYL